MIESSRTASSRPRTAPATLWLVRHGESTWNVLGRAQGQSDEAELTAGGRRQAEVVAENLAARPIRAIYASDLRRAAQTAAPLARRLRLPVWPDSRLRERSLGVLEGADSRRLVPAVNGIAGDAVVDVDARPPGGESLSAFHRRAAEFLADLTDAGGDVVIVTHGGTLRMLRACLDRVSVGEITWSPVPNCAIERRPLDRSGRAPGPSRTPQFPGEDHR